MRPVASYGLLAPAFHADPAPVLARMRREAPVHWDPALAAWIVTRHADVAALVRDPRCSVDRGGSIARAAGGLDATTIDRLAWCSDFVLRWMVFSDPPHHTRVRAAVHRAFAANAVARLRPAIDAAVERALARTRRAGRFEVLADLAVPVPAEVTAALLGVPVEDTELLKAWTADMFALFGAGVAGAPVIDAAHRSLRACRDYFAALLAARRRDPGDDLTSALARADGLDDDDRIGICATLVAGAYETTTHVVGNGVWALLRHPAELARLRAEPALIDNAVEEIFRWDGPALSVVRRATCELAVGDATIAAGDKIYCMLYAANRDPDRYPDPDRFDVARADPRHLGLGHGIHFCLGAALSRLEAASMLRAVVRLPGLALDREALAGDAPVYEPNLAIRGLRALPVRHASG